MKTLLAALLLAIPLWAAPPEANLKAIGATGLPIYVLDEKVTGTYTTSRLSPELPLYSMDYRLEMGATLRLYCCRAPYKGIQRTGTYLTSKPAQAGMFGATTATAYKQYCRTDWMMIPGRAAVLIEGEGVPLARFLELLSQFHRLPDRQRGNAFQLAAQASGLPVIRLGKQATFLESYHLAARPGQGSWLKSYLVGPGTLYLSLHREKPPSAARGAKILRRRVLSVPGLGDLEIYEAQRNGQKFCFSKPLKLVQTCYLQAKSEGISLDQFQALLAQFEDHQP